MKVALSTDTSCTISKELASKLNIFVFPLNVIINGEEFLDGVTINQAELCEAMRGGKNIKTSTPPPSSVIEYFNDIFAQGYDYVVHFTISSKLSSMNQLFNNISNSEFDGKIIVIDGYSVSRQMLSHVIFVHDEIEKGTDIHEIQKLIDERNNDNCHCVFIPENLTALKNGGRISPAIAAIGNMIGLKPLIALHDGALVKDNMTRNVKKAFVDKIDELSSSCSIDKYDYSVVSFDGNEQLVNFLIKYIENKFEGYHILLDDIAINVCAHCGPGTIGVLVTPKINGKSIYEYLK